MACISMPALNWFVSQQPPTDDASVNDFDVTTALEKVFAKEKHVIHIKAFDPPQQEKQLVLDTPGIVWLGEEIAKHYLK